ncbi:ABC transporter, ATP binding protein [Aeropyrum pernix K1]|uniref:ABC transporter, ATP binding protein n=1 Tax=Aeropyrum pernix (strain ATCC 700893 / DSM 11879 / JCM 9820 / NBRC 100138 / K1) TaxID=272557 RepID=Q9YG38_AERPE|nr:ABC transporter ATP-binding protein [Aeropyrum pernix]BAA78972.1 ABC transporter, ATP binding protein [Aeropyrum pernix K1]
MFKGLAVEDLDVVYPGGVHALKGVTASFPAGVVTALLGENGAGKTTLLKAIMGVVKPRKGRILVDGYELRPKGPGDSLRSGIYMASQNPPVYPGIKAYEDLAVTLMVAGRKAGLRQARTMLAEASEALGLNIDPDRYLGEMGFSERQRLEVIKALALGSRAVLLDEPTTHLTPEEAARMLEAAGRLAASGAAVLLVTHRIGEAMEHADRLVILRKGVKVYEGPPPSSTEEVAKLMFGEVLAPREPKTFTAATSTGRPVLSVDRVSLPPRLRMARLEVRQGEVVGVAGVAGNGQEELFEVIVGLRKPAKGRILIAGVDVTRAPPLARRRLGLGVIPEERLGHALVPGESIAFNIALSIHTARDGFIVDWRYYEKLAEEMIRDMGIKAVSPRQMVDELSGGNMQRLVLARELWLKPRLLVAMNPAAGLDLEGQQAVAEMMRMSSERGGVLVIDEDLDFLLRVSNKIYVASGGIVKGPYLPTEEKSIVTAMGGLE